MATFARKLLQLLSPFLLLFSSVAFSLEPSLTVNNTVKARSEKPSPGAWPSAIYKWHYNPANKPAWLTPQQAFNLVKASANVWKRCGVKMQFKGLTNQPPGKMDRQNVMGWSLKIPARLRGLTVGQAKAGVLLERDVLIRPDRKEFELSSRLLRKVIAHEFGHAIGITHSKNCNDVMTLAASCPKTSPTLLPTVPTPYDLKRCLSIYPPK